MPKEEKAKTKGTTGDQPVKDLLTVFRREVTGYVDTTGMDMGVSRTSLPLYTDRPQYGNYNHFALGDSV
jgi:hypothetical protein